MLPGVSACIDDEIAMTDETEEEYDGGDMINIIVTLDNMGGSIASRTTPSELTYLENYVDPQKLRVLFFDSNDKFLFESMSRWVKRLDPTSANSTWSVSVPLYSYGNDKGDYDWEWDKIRKELTSKQFKVAILANRPAYQYYPDLNDAVFGDYWYDNSGPNWTRRNSVVYEGNDGAVKDVFDLHHCQFDPIYFNKSYDKGTDGSDRGGKAYDFIMGDWTPGTETSEGIPKMGATSSWLDFSNNDKVKDPRGWGMRKSRLPSEEEPIPMYGIQLFEPLKTWKKGTTIELNREGDKAVSLLRSVVKVDLLVPTGFGGENGYDVVVFYGNWFTRCEPMDVWTPTDQIWVSKHGSTAPGAWARGDCEWMNIWNYGTIANNNQINGVNSYKQRLSWIYGAWRAEKGWSFGNAIDNYFDSENRRSLVNGEARYNPTYPFPKIFNPCVQRITTVYVDKTYSEGGYDHFVIYTGERNVNDPSSLVNPSSSGSGNSPVLYWCIVTGDKDDEGKYTGYVDRLSGQGDNIYNAELCAHTYCFPMVDYDNGADLFNCTREGILITNVKGVGPGGLWTPGNSNYPIGINTAQNNAGYANGTGMGEYMMRVAGHASYTGSNYVRVGDQVGITYSGRDIPLPLLRNHVYTLTLDFGNGATSRSSSKPSLENLTVSSKVLATEDITVIASAIKQ